MRSRRNLRTPQASVKTNLDLLPKNSGTTALREAALKLLALGEGKSGVFKIRQQELDATDHGQVILEETGKLNVGLGISVQQLVDGVQTETDASTWQARKEISLATTVMLTLGGLTLVGIRAVRLALCRPQHPAADRQPAALDAASVRRRPRHRKSIAAASATRSRRWRIRWRFSAKA